MREFSLAETETLRLELQSTLDAARTPKQRNESGQFATPPDLARDIIDCAIGFHHGRNVRFLEPSCGTGAFFSALLSQANNLSINKAVGVEIDKRFVDTAKKLWGKVGFDVLHADFLQRPSRIGQGFSLLVANPPYVRHHHLSTDQKTLLKEQVRAELQLNVSGLAGLYVYFLLLSHRYLARGAVSAWLLPSEFLDTGYGQVLRQYLAERVTINRIHRFDPEGTQFEDALVSSVVVVFTNELAANCHEVEFTQGGKLNEPETTWHYTQSSLDPARKWGAKFSARGSNEIDVRSRFDEFFKVRRGIATGDNSFFILPRERIESLGIKRENVTPILPAPRSVRQDVIETASNGYPLIPDQRAVIQPSASSIDEIRETDPALADYLARAGKKTLNAYLVKSRRCWFRVERRDPAPILLTYMGRISAKNGPPFRFIRNNSQAIATNMYLMLYPIGELEAALNTKQLSMDTLLSALRSISAEELLDSGRVYGGGLRKIEPNELASMDAQVVADLVPKLQPETVLL